VRAFLLGKIELRLKASSSLVVSGDLLDVLTQPKNAAVTVSEIAIERVRKSITALLEKTDAFAEVSPIASAAKTFFGFTAKSMKCLINMSK
jgi:hypothetical protein